MVIDYNKEECVKNGLKITILIHSNFINEVILIILYLYRNILKLLKSIINNITLIGVYIDIFILSMQINKQNNLFFLMKRDNL